LLLASRGIFANRELTVLLAIAIGLGSSWGAHALGISPALGAFVAGMLLGESPYATQIRSDIGAARIIMVTLFFASVGMLAKPLWFLTHIHWIIAAAAAIFVCKTVIIFGTGRLFGLDSRHALATGITLAQVGEFSLVLAVAGRDGGILGADGFDLIVSVIIALMFAAPYMVSRAFALSDGMLTIMMGRHSTQSLQNQSEKAESPGRVLVVGLGPAGQEVVRHLKQAQLEPVVIDINPRSRIKAHEMGVTVNLGDASGEDVLLHAQLQNVCMAVVTVPDPGVAVRIIETIRGLKSELPIAARCRYNRYMNDIKQAGADIIVDEEVNLGHDLAHRIVDFMQKGTGVRFACRLAGRIDPHAAQ
jgi:CPA2 family monovalent cation:H+ antiporter-2